MLKRELPKTRSDLLNEKEERLLCMEQALNQERERLRKEREELSMSVTVEDIRDYKENHKRVQSFISELEEDEGMLKELGFVVNPENFDVFHGSEYSYPDVSDSGSLESFLKADSEEVNQMTNDCLEKIKALQQELEENPFKSFSENNGGSNMPIFD